MADNVKKYTSVREMFPSLAKELDDEIATRIAEGKYEHDGMLYTREEILDLLFGVPAAESFIRPLQSCGLGEVKRFDLPPRSGPFIGPVQEAAPTPPLKAEPSLCPCGAELMGARAVSYKMCGDCQGLWCQGSAKSRALDQRIAEAQPPKVDKDPTEAWGAGATANWEWP